MAKMSSFLLWHNLPLSLVEVRENLADLSTFGKHHPLIESVEKLDAGHYVFHEFTPLLFGLKIRFRYPAQIILASDPSLIVYTAKTQGMSIQLNFKLEYDAFKQHTTVVEEVKLRGPFLFHFPLRQMIRKSHIELFRSMGSQAMNDPKNNSHA